MKICTGCDIEKPYSEFYRNGQNGDGFHMQCKSCQTPYHKRYRDENRERVNKRKRDLYHNDPEFRANYEQGRRRRKYGLSEDAYQKLLDASDGNCMICKKPWVGDRKLSIDHNHKTGKVRGLLCRICNVFLGRIDDSTEILEAMIAYLKE